MLLKLVMTNNLSNFHICKIKLTKLLTKIYTIIFCKPLIYCGLLKLITTTALHTFKALYNINTLYSIVKELELAIKLTTIYSTLYSHSAEIIKK